MIFSTDPLLLLQTKIMYVPLYIIWFIIIYLPIYLMQQIADLAVLRNIK